MPDLDAYQAGGATGAMSRAAQLAALQAANAANAERLAASLLRQPVRQARPEVARPAPPQARLPAGQLPPSFPGDTRQPMPGQPPAGQLPPNFPGSSPRNYLFDVPGMDRSGLGVDPIARLPQPQTGVPSTQPLPSRPRAGNVPPPKKPPTSRPISKGLQIQNEEVAQKIRTSVGQMMSDLNNDPIPDGATDIAKELLNGFRKGIQTRLLGMDDLADNPVVHLAHDASIWAKQRRKNADFIAVQNKVSGDDDAPVGDGTFANMVDWKDFTDAAKAVKLSAALNVGNLPATVVARDESGLLQIMDAEQWVNGKFAEMSKDPRYAAQLITALSMTSLYGSDSVADGQRSRVMQDKDGNPVKAIPGEEDLKALQALARTAIINQSQGSTESIDDFFARIARMGREITDANIANGDYGSGGGGGRGGGGFGGGGGGGQSVRLTDPTALASMLDSIGRQRMGRSLSPAEAQAFINHVHDLERQSAAAYYAGGEYTPVDMEGQAVDWIQNQYQREAAANQYGDLASQFIALMGSSNPFGVIAS